eukprot:1299896-Prymnesium_polylepis.1
MKRRPYSMGSRICRHSAQGLGGLWNVAGSGCSSSTVGVPLRESSGLSAMGSSGVASLARAADRYAARRNPTSSRCWSRNGNWCVSSDVVMAGRYRRSRRESTSSATAHPAMRYIAWDPCTRSLTAVSTAASERPRSLIIRE